MDRNLHVLANSPKVSLPSGVNLHTDSSEWLQCPPMTPLAQYAIKVGLSAVLIVAIAEIAKRSTGFAALVASLPLTSLLAFVWLHLDGTAATEIGTLSRQIFWLVLPSLILFLLLPVLLERGFAFWPSLGMSMLATIGGYFLMLFVLKKFGMLMS